MDGALEISKYAHTTSMLNKTVHARKSCSKAFPFYFVLNKQKACMYMKSENIKD